MTTLPPEDQNTPGTSDQPQPPQAPRPPQVPQPPAQPQYEAPQSPSAPQQPEYEAPQAPAQPQAPAAPQAPAQPQYQAQQPAQPQYQAPPAGGGYQAPPAGGYQAPAGAPVADPTGNITLNYWLSVFFGWIPGLIFYIIDKDKGDQRLRQLQAANLNFTLLRVAVGIITVIPYIGWFIGGIAGIVLFVFHIIAATKAVDAYRQGGNDPFIFNIPLVK